ncbi:hypothetical protein J6590_041265 [Homalodisca vitripennis]|nr:hypothetical protein J6590_041265 [Homalodisca vitripennis]
MNYLKPEVARSLPSGSCRCQVFGADKDFLPSAHFPRIRRVGTYVGESARPEGPSVEGGRRNTRQTVQFRVRHPAANVRALTHLWYG